MLQFEMSFTLYCHILSVSIEENFIHVKIK